MSSEGQFAVIVPVKSAIVAGAEYGEHAIVRCGVPKKYAVPMKFTWELVHQGGTEAVAALLREQNHGLTALEEAAVISGAEAAIAFGAAVAIPAGTPVIVVVLAGVGVVVMVGLAEPYILELAGYIKKSLLEAQFPVTEPCEQMYWLGREAKEAAEIHHSDPLVLDLNGDGIKTTHVSAGTYFDQDANGFAERTGWVSPEDGLLVLDQNGDGMINDGRELFSDQTVLKSGRRATNGFEALKKGSGLLLAHVELYCGFPSLTDWH
ncbi:MAG: hypothetical protein HY913_08210 [Desulfomonile tiedjei]|nr:hypothetical protein [Desulfomonile tiedjei]